MKIEQPVKILVQRRAAIGDVIMTTGVVRELQRKYNGAATIDVATDFPDVYANNPYVRNVFTYDKIPDNEQWDCIYDLDNAYELNPCNHFVDSYFYRVFGNIDLDKSVELYATPEERAQVDADIAVIDSKFIVVHMRKWHWELKNISADVWFKIFEGIFTDTVDYKIVTVGGPSDSTLAGHPLFVNANGKYTLGQLKHLMDHASCFVGIDSAPFAVAGASNVPIVALLSHMNPQSILPYRQGVKGQNCRVVQADVPCVGCYERQPRPVQGISCANNYECTYKWDTDVIVKTILGRVK